MAELINDPMPQSPSWAKTVVGCQRPRSPIYQAGSLISSMRASSHGISPRPEVTESCGKRQGPASLPHPFFPSHVQEHEMCRWKKAKAMQGSCNIECLVAYRHQTHPTILNFHCIFHITIPYYPSHADSHAVATSSFQPYSHGPKLSQTLVLF